MNINYLGKCGSFLNFRKGSREREKYEYERDTSIGCHACMHQPGI